MQNLLESSQAPTSAIKPQSAKPPEEMVYRSLTVAAVVLLLVSLWAF